MGVSSLEETLPADKCCTFRGSLVKLDTRSGAIQWQTYTVPDNGGRLGGYSGGAIWGSSPAIDVSRGIVYVATGNLYTAPQEVTECQEKQNNQTTKPTKPDQCTGSDVHFNSIIALDINSGKVIWSQQLGGYDIFYFACLVPNNPDCPPGPNVDADFGEAPMLLTITSNRTLLDIVVAVQKSGFAWALDRDNGEIVWFKVNSHLKPHLSSDFFFSFFFVAKCFGFGFVVACGTRKQRGRRDMGCSYRREEGVHQHSQWCSFAIQAYTV